MVINQMVINSNVANSAQIMTTVISIRRRHMAPKVALEEVDSSINRAPNQEAKVLRQRYARPLNHRSSTEIRP